MFSPPPPRRRSDFNPHEREARDGALALFIGEAIGILIHTSVKLVTSRGPPHKAATKNFNPHEREARDACKKRTDNGVGILIHTSVKLVTDHGLAFQGTGKAF